MNKKNLIIAAGLILMVFTVSVVGNSFLPTVVSASPKPGN
jgi:hypothetical protein